MGIRNISEAGTRMRFPELITPHGDSELAVLLHFKYREFVS